MTVKVSRDLISSHTNTLLPSNIPPSADQMQLIQMNLIKITMPCYLKQLRPH